MGLPPSGKRIDVQLMDIIRFGDDGLAHEHWGVFDAMTMMQQLGVVPGHRRLARPLGQHSRQPALDRAGDGVAHGPSSKRSTIASRKPSTTSRARAQVRSRSIWAIAAACVQRTSLARISRPGIASACAFLLSSRLRDSWKASVRWAPRSTWIIPRQTVLERSPRMPRNARSEVVSGAACSWSVSKSRCWRPRVA